MIKTDSVVYPKEGEKALDQNGFVSMYTIFFIDFILINIAFFSCYFFVSGHVALSGDYLKLLFMFYLCWLAASMVAKKFRSSSYTAYKEGFLVFFRSSIYLTYFVILWVVVSDYSVYSRSHVFGTCAMIFVLESLVWFIYNQKAYFKGIERMRPTNIPARLRVETHISYSLLVLDFILVIAAFFMANYLKRAEFVLHPGHENIFLLIIGIWFAVSMATKKFSLESFRNVYFFTWQWIKAGFLMLAVMSILIFGLQLFEYSRFQSFGAILVLLPMEIIMVSFFYRISKGQKNEEDIESVDDVKNILKQDVIPEDFDIDLIRQKLMQPAREKLRKRLESSDPVLFDFLDHHIDLDAMVRMETAIERSNETFDLIGDRPPVRLFFNLWKNNDIRKLNEYFLHMHQILLPGGYYVGHANTIHTYHEWMYKKYPRYFAHLLYLINFCFYRIMPKLPGLQKIYFAITKGKGRIISRAELLGRLVFCGFEIVGEKEINQKLYVIARKVKTSSLDTSPTYGPLIQLKRSGFEGKTVIIYKFRTMHPYSEYLQQYIYDLQGLQKGGKIENDFRMTTWGKFMRKLWLDELPMLYNWLKGDLSLVGVRPLSFHYLSLYDQELKELRKKVKPGLLPPFYADLPTTFEEVCESERRYIKRFLQRPFRTQCVYFWKSFVNIVIKGARSN